MSITTLTKRVKKSRLVRRHALNLAFRTVAVTALCFALSMLFIMFSDLIARGTNAFTQTYIALDIHLDPDTLGIFDANDPQQLTVASYRQAVSRAIEQRFPEAGTRKKKRELIGLFSLGSASVLQKALVSQPKLLNTQSSWWLLARHNVDRALKAGFLEQTNSLSSFQLDVLKQLSDSGELRRRLNWQFFLGGDSTEPEQAGIGAALLGSLFTLLLTLLFSFPIALATSIYLEEYASHNRFNKLIEVNINNLVAAPPIIFGLLGLAIFVNFFELSRSIPLVAALVLTLMTIPAMISANRNAIKMVPLGIREAATSMGASKMQTIMHYILPIALPDILAGALVALGKALGEGASLLLIGMAVFIVDKPASIHDPATVLPIQIYLWAQSPEPAFVEHSAAAILVLLALLMLMNSLAVYLRRRGS